MNITKMPSFVGFDPFGEIDNKQDREVKHAAVVVQLHDKKFLRRKKLKQGAWRVSGG